MRKMHVRGTGLQSMFWMRDWTEGITFTLTSEGKSSASKKLQQKPLPTSSLARPQHACIHAQRREKKGEQSEAKISTSAHLSEPLG